MKPAVARASEIEGRLAPEELDWLATQASRRRAVVEIGSGKGRSTKALALSTEGVVYAVDPSEDAIFQSFSRNLFAEIQTGRVVPIRADGLEAVEQLRQLLPPGGADMLFLDGPREYADVRREIQRFRALLGPLGLLCGHDYDGFWPGVLRAVGELAPAHQRGPGSLWWLAPAF